MDRGYVTNAPRSGKGRVHHASNRSRDPGPTGERRDNHALVRQENSASALHSRDYLQLLAAQRHNLREAVSKRVRRRTRRARAPRELSSRYPRQRPAMARSDSSSEAGSGATRGSCKYPTPVRTEKDSNAARSGGPLDDQ